MKRLVIMPALLMGTRPFDAISLAQPRHIQPILPVTKEIEMHQKDTGRLTRMLRASGTFFAPLVVASHTAAPNRTRPDARAWAG